MATQVFTIRGGISSGGQDATLLYHADHDVETFLEVRDSPIANNTDFLTDSNRGIGCCFDYQFPDEWVVARVFFLFKQLYNLAGANIESASITYDMIGMSPLFQDWHYDIVIQKANSSDIHHQPPVAGDFNVANIEAASGGSKNTSDMVDGAWVTIDLNATGISWIGKNINDILKVVLRSSDDINGKAPLEDSGHINFMSVNTGNASTTAARPYITITITVVIPTVTTQAATDIETTKARFNGTIVDRGYWLSTYGFEWKKGIGGSVTSIQVGTGGASQSVTTFNYLKTGLTSATTYYFRAWGNNNAGKGYGEWVEFTTLGVASVTTQAAAVPVPVSNPAYCEFADGNGTITSTTNATERGFEVKHEYSGDLCGAIKHSIAGFEGDTSWDWDAWAWVGTLIKTETEGGDFEEGAFTLELGNFPAQFFDQLFAGESYTYRAYAVIGGATYYGEWVAFSLGVYVPDGYSPGVSDDQLPIEDIIPPLPPIKFPPFKFPPFEWPEFEWPEFDYPDIPPYNGSWLGAFYYRKAFGKKDLDELRKKCRIFLDNSVEYALVLNHNMQVLKQFLNDMHNYMTDIDEYNTFKPIIPTQWVNELAHKPLDIKDFKVIINNFISNSIDNASNVNHNFRLIRDGLSDVMSGEDIGMEINSIELRTKTVEDDNPDVGRLKKVVDALSSELEGNYETINHNLHVIRATLI